MQAELTVAGTSSRASARATAASLGLQGANFASRFLLLVVLARTLHVTEVGIYGLVAVTIVYALHPLGLDFYVFNRRELICRSRGEAPRLLRDQLSLHAACYAIVLPAAALLFAYGLLPISVAPWFFALLVTEHLALEGQRALFALSRPVTANAVLFLRSGAWVSVLAVLLLGVPELRALETVWAVWLLGSATGLIVVAWALRDLPWAAAVRGRPDFRWLASGLRVALPFLGSSLALRGITTFDRHALAWARGEEEVGIYAIGFGITNLVPVLCEMGLAMVLFPAIVAAWQRGDRADYARRLRGLSVALLALAGTLAAALVIGLRPLLALLAEPTYAEALTTYRVLLAAAVVTALGLVPHYALYARRADRPLVAASGLGLAVALAANFLLTPPLGHLGTALATLAAMSTVTSTKAVAWLRSA